MRAPERTSSGSPRSGKGIVTRSKSRGTTVAGNSCVASSTTWCAHVARGDVCEREQLHICLLRREGGLTRGRVRRLAREARSVREERRLVDEKISAYGRLDDRGGRRRIARDHDLPPCTRRRRGPPKARRRDRLRVRCSRRVATRRLAPVGTPEPVRALDIEPARSLFLDERVADRRDSVLGREDRAARSRPDRVSGRPRARSRRTGYGSRPKIRRRSPKRSSSPARPVDRERLSRPRSANVLSIPGRPR